MLQIHSGVVCVPALALEMLMPIYLWVSKVHPCFVFFLIRHCIWHGFDVCDRRDKGLLEGCFELMCVNRGFQTVSSTDHAQRLDRYSTLRTFGDRTR